MYCLIQDLREKFPVRNLCQVLKISRNAYYSWLQGRTYQASTEKTIILKLVKEIFDRHKRRYGARRIREELKDMGYHIGIYRIRSLMKQQGLVAIQPKSFVPKTTASNPGLRRVPNLLLDEQNLPTAPNQVIVGDITYLPSAEYGYNIWLYLAIWLDLFSRKIVGWSVDRHMETSLVIRAMSQVIRRRQPEKGFIVHSDGGGQYGCGQFRRLLSLHEFRQSMTRKDNHYDNAFIESLFSRFKAELLNGKSFLGLADAKAKTFDYIEGYYNTIRKHSSLGYLSPDQFEEQFWMDSWKNQNQL